MPSNIYAAAVNPAGDLMFAAWHTSSSSVDLRGYTLIPGAAPQSHVQFPLAAFDYSDIAVDANGRFVVPALTPFPDTTGIEIHRLEGQTFVLLAGGNAAATATQDGQGAQAKIRTFTSPVVDEHGLIYFIDFSAEQGKYHLRTLGSDGTVRTVLADSPKGRLISRADGHVLLFAYDFSQLAAPGQWYELNVSAAGLHSWQPLTNRWPNLPQGLLPLGPVVGTTDTFWAKEMTLAPDGPAKIMQYRLDGTVVGSITSTTTATRPTRVVSGSLLVVGICSIARYTNAAGTEVIRYGKEPVVGQADGVQGNARLQFKPRDFFSAGAEAYTVTNGDVYVASQGSPMRHVTSQGSVSSLPQLVGVGRNLAKNADGDWITISRFPSGSTSILKAAADGSSNWTTWVGATSDAAHQAPLAYLTALRLDAAGMVWFSEGGPGTVRDGYGTAFPPPALPERGGNMMGQVNRQGQVSAVVGRLDDVFTLQNYPSEEQRPWYFDVIDFGLESASVGWMLCTRPLIQNASITGSAKAVLFRVANGSLNKRIELPDTFYSEGADKYTRLCLHPGRPGEVFLATHSAVFRWTDSQGLVLLAGTPQYPSGVKLGALPAGLAEVKFLAPGPTAASLYVGSENSVLRLNLPV